MWDNLSHHFRIGNGDWKALLTYRLPIHAAELIDHIKHVGGFIVRQHGSSEAFNHLDHVQPYWKQNAIGGRFLVVKGVIVKQIVTWIEFYDGAVLWHKIIVCFVKGEEVASLCLVYCYNVDGDV